MENLNDRPRPDADLEIEDLGTAMELAFTVGTASSLACLSEVVNTQNGSN